MHVKIANTNKRRYACTHQTPEGALDEVERVLGHGGGCREHDVHAPAQKILNSAEHQLVPDRVPSHHASEKHMAADNEGKGRMEMFYLTTHSTHVIYGYMASV